MKQLSILLIITTIFTRKSLQECKITTANVGVLYGKPTHEDIRIATCNYADISKQNQPLIINNYPNYLQIKEPNKQQVNSRILYENTFNKLPNLKTLRFIQTSLSEIQPKAFRGLKDLIELNLHRNQLQTLPVNVFEDLKELKMLDLSNNRLESLEKNIFKPLTKLEELKLNGNRLNVLQPEWFVATKNLKKLSLNANNFSYIKAETFKNLNKLEVLELNVDRITKVDRNAFKGLDNLKKLSLVSNKLIDIDLPAELENLKKLDSLDIIPSNFYCSMYLPAAKIIRQKQIQNALSSSTTSLTCSQG